MYAIDHPQIEQPQPKLIAHELDGSLYFLVAVSAPPVWLPPLADQADVQDALESKTDKDCRAMLREVVRTGEFDIVQIKACDYSAEIS